MDIFTFIFLPLLLEKKILPAQFLHLSNFIFETYLYHTIHVLYKSLKSNIIHKALMDFNWNLKTLLSSDPPSHYVPRHGKYSKGPFLIFYLNMPHHIADRLYFHRLKGLFSITHIFLVIMYSVHVIWQGGVNDDTKKAF